MDCARVKTEGIAERYLLGTLIEAEQEAFEEHLIACTACLAFSNAVFKSWFWPRPLTPPDSMSSAIRT